MVSVLRRYGTIIGFASIVAIFWISLPDTFMTGRNWLNISQQVSMLAVTAIAMTIVMVMGDFDLSVGSMASLAGIVAAILFTQGFRHSNCRWRGAAGRDRRRCHQWRSCQLHRHPAVYCDPGHTDDFLWVCFPYQRWSNDFRKRHSGGIFRVCTRGRQPK